MSSPAASTTNQRFEIVYNLYPFQESLFLPNAYICSKDKKGELTHLQQRAIPETIGAFEIEMDATRKKIFDLIDLLQPKSLAQKFNTNKRKEKPLVELLEQEELKPSILSFAHRKLDELLLLLTRHQLPISWNVERRVLAKDFILKQMPDKLSPLLFFRKTPEKVFYRLTLKEGEDIWHISKKEVIPITNKPAWIFANYRLYQIDHINGNMVKPFQQKDEVAIPSASVSAYFQKFILKVASKVDIEAEGFAVIQLDELEGCELEVVRHLFTAEWMINVNMCYPGTTFHWREQRQQKISLKIGAQEVEIVKVQRQVEKEKVYIDKLASFSITPKADSHYLSPKLETEEPYALFEWLGHQRAALEKAGFTLLMPEIDGHRIMLAPPSLDLSSSQDNDWFDIHGEVKVGDFSFPFIKLMPYIKAENCFFPLPDGTYFLIPNAWLNKYKDLAKFAKTQHGQLRLTKSQFTLLDELKLQVPQMDDLVQADFRPSPLLKADLRPYQLAGLQWLVNLYHNELGACLADDMGLGKTLQTIAVLLHAKEHKKTPEPEAKTKGPSTQLDLFQAPPDAFFLKSLNALIILPASLVFNWAQELQKFAPSLSVYQHSGTKRYNDPRLILRFDVVLTTYQTALRDANLLQKIDFEYIILDESQQIKNRESKVFQAINTFPAKHKISLSGTPIENSLSDLWSQMQFINPELLGSFAFFKREFISPIEKEQDDEKKERLRKLVKPYLLRRTKEEVAKDLPPLTTKLFYSEMGLEQKKLYEKEKSAARNYLLENFDGNSPQYRIMVLQSLTRLRQIVNHPSLVFPDFKKESGKFSDVLEHWEVIRKGGHKVLIFSSFTQYLELFRDQFDQSGLAYSWLTGQQTGPQRQQAVKQFMENPDIQSFLISIKAGGTGLNLTAADYVFILDPWWNPSTEQQAIARAHRIGQDKNVMAVKFITKDSIEEKILTLQERKAQLAEDIIGEVGKMSFTKGDIQYLLE
ncbi:MAG: DEAD/DEAH box helicase [Saprospiraceae bacterium]